MLRLMSSASSSGGRSTHWSGGFIERPPLFTVRPMTFAGYSLLVRSFTLAGLTLILGACMDSGGGASPTTQANSVTISGTVGGTRIVAMNDNDQIVVEDDTAGRPAPECTGPIPFHPGEFASLIEPSSIFHQQRQSVSFLPRRDQRIHLQQRGTGRPGFRHNERGNRPLDARISSGERHS